MSFFGLFFFQSFCIENAYSDSNFEILAESSPENTGELSSGFQGPDTFGDSKKTLLLAGSPSFLVVNNSNQINPQSEKLFTVLLTLNLSTLPSESSRQNLVVKYDRDMPPYSGWGLSLKSFNTSIRPEVYWKDRRSRGGWYTFGKVSLEIGKWYQFFLIAKPFGYISLYYLEYDNSIGNPPDTTQKPLAVEFLGGYDVRNISVPLSSGDLTLGSFKRNRNSFRGRFASVITNRLDVKDFVVSDLVKQLANGGSGLLDPGSADFYLLDGKDISKSKRSLSLGGSAAWAID